MVVPEKKLVLPAIVEPQSNYLANMRALWENAPPLAQELDLIDETEFAACTPAKNGDMTCQITTEKGLVFLHSRYDPRKEAQHWLEGVQEKARSQQDIKNGTYPMCYIVDGFGLGYHIQALYDWLQGDAIIVVSESNLAILRAALEHNDYSEMLASGKIVFITKADRSEIFKKIQAFGNLMLMGMVFTHPLVNFNADYHRIVHTLISEYAAFARTHLLSLLGIGLRTCENILANMPTYVGCPPINTLKQRFAGYPVVIVSAGPSLQRNIDLLAPIRDRIVIIAVQTTLKPLLARGITPDFVTSLDYHEVSQRFFDGLEDLHEIQMVAEPKANSAVIDYYRPRGPVSLLGNDFASLIMGQEDDGHDRIPPGATVAHLSFYLAEYLGADPIIFIGQDLAFTDHVYYSPGTALHTTWQPELNRFCTLEMKEWERIVRGRGTLRKIPDIHGQPIYADEQMYTYLQQFEKDFAKCPAKVIDASEGGAFKHYCQIMPLAETIKLYCQRPIDPDLFSYRQSYKSLNLELLPPAMDQIRQRITEAEELKGIVEETIVLVTEMLDLLDDQTGLNQKMVRLDELRVMVKRRPDIYRLVCYVSQAAELFRFRQDRMLEAETIEGRERQRRQLTRDIGYVSEIGKGCDRLLDMLNRCIERMEKTLKP